MFDKTLEKFRDKLQSFSANEKLWFLSVLAHNITVSVRATLTESQIDVSKLYALNQIQHQVTSRLTSLLEQSDEWDENTFAETLFDYALDGNCTGELDFAVQQTLKTNKVEKSF
jgi:hypothetical protein